MRIPILLSLFGAAAILACSSGGPGTLGDSPLDLGREPVSDGQFFSPYEAPPNKGAAIQTGSSDQGSNPTTPTGKDGGKVTVDIDASIPSGFDAGTTTTSDASSVKDTGGGTPTGVCADLQTCCDSLSGTTRTQCTSLASANSEPACQQQLDFFVDGGKC